MDKPAVGLWLSSDSDEKFPWGPFFASREEAIAHARSEEHRYVGRVALVVDAEMVAKAILRFDDADERLCDENELCPDDHLLDIGREDEGLIRASVVELLKARKLVPSWFQVESTETVEEADA